MNIPANVKKMMEREGPPDDMENFTKAVDFYETSGFVTPPSVVAAGSVGDFSSLLHRRETDTMIDTMVPDDEGICRYPLLGAKCVHRIMPNIHEHIGEGTTGHVYSMITRHGPMAVKFQKHSVEYGKKPFAPGNGCMDVPMNEFALEVAIQIHMSSIGCSPHVYNAWISPYSTTWSGDDQDEQDVLVMDRLCETLFDRTSRETSYTENVIELIDQMHDNGVFHGDLHSGNLMVGEDSKSWVIDFGKSKTVPSGQEERKWCVVHDFVLLHNSLLRRSELKALLNGRILEPAPDRTVLGATFDL